MSRLEQTDEFSEENKEEFDRRADEAFDDGETIDLYEWIADGE